MKNNPFVGPRPYEKGDRRNFYGRDREARDLVSLIFAEREVLLYAPSGAGKTSLLNAMIIPTLEEEGFQVLPVTRVGRDLPPETLNNAIGNIYVYSILQGLADSNISFETNQGYTLLSFLREFYFNPKSNARNRPPLLILDQFEELFTSHQERWKDAGGFFQQVREALDAEPSLGILTINARGSCSRTRSLYRLLAPSSGWTLPVRTSAPCSSAGSPNPTGRPGGLPVFPRCGRAAGGRPQPDTRPSTRRGA